MVGAFDQTLHTFLDDMYETMVSAHGLGVAAPQVGDSRRIAIIDLTVDDIDAPENRSTSGIAPGEHIHRERLEIVNAKITGSGLLAFALQHEIDHLDGTLFTDHLSPLKKQLFLRWCKKHLAVEAD